MFYGSLWGLIVSEGKRGHHCRQAVWQEKQSENSAEKGKGERGGKEGRRKEEMMRSYFCFIHSLLCDAEDIRLQHEDIIPSYKHPVQPSASI